MSTTQPTERTILERRRDRALRALERFDSAEKGSRWITHPDEGRRLGDELARLEAALEAGDDICVACWSQGPDAWETCPGPDHDPV